MAGMQNYANHARYVPLYHFVAGPILIANAIYAIWHLKDGVSLGSGLYAATAVALVLAAFFARFFALKAQDRVIRLEMRMRLRDVLPPSQHAEINQLALNQIVALRFASDAELPALVALALKDNLGGRDIKKRIATWVPDYDRV
jgi:hypothetical protein